MRSEIGAFVGGDFIGGDDCKSRPRRQRRGHEFVTVAVLAGNGKEGLAGDEAAAIDRDSAHAGGQRAGTLGAHRLRHRLHAPERAHATPLPRSAAATASWSLNGNTCLPTIWPVSWPLPAMSRTSPRRRSAIAVPIASPRSPISTAPAAACRIALRIAAACSLRGLSSVTTT